MTKKQLNRKRAPLRRRQMGEKREREQAARDRAWMTRSQIEVRKAHRERQGV